MGQAQERYPWKVKIDTTLPVEDYDRLREIAREDRASIAALVRTAVVRYIDWRLPPDERTEQDDP